MRGIDDGSDHKHHPKKVEACAAVLANCGLPHKIRPFKLAARPLGYENNKNRGPIRTDPALQRRWVQKSGVLSTELPRASILLKPFVPYARTHIERRM